MLSNSIRRVNKIMSTTPLWSAVRGNSEYKEGKTKVHVPKQEADPGLMIDTYATFGFKLNNGLTVLGPIAIFPKTVMSWQVNTAEEITEESLRLFKMLKPKIDLLVIGLDSCERSLGDQVFKAAQANGLNVEILTTDQACSTYNFLSSEGRSVAGALIPPTTVPSVNEDGMLHTKMHYHDEFNKPLM